MAAHRGPVGQDEEAGSTTSAARGGADHGGVRLREEEEAGKEDGDVVEATWCKEDA